MKHQLFLAWKYLQYHWVKTTILILSIAFILFIPLGLNTLSDKGSKDLMARAKSTPLLIGAKGSETELALSGLYFKSNSLEAIPFKTVTEISNTNLGEVIPLNLEYYVKEFPIVGTASSYFKFRDANFKSGRAMAILGECVLGSKAAEVLGIKVGESVISSPKSAFDVSGSYPLKMTVVGILNATNTADDEAVFTDVKTTWVISGFAHGHDNVTETTADSLLLSKTKENAIASPAVLTYNEITPENISSFHFHGNPDAFPVQAIVVNPNSKKDGLILRGRFENRTDNLQIVVPTTVMQELLDTVVSVKNLLLLAAISIGLATLVIVTLVFSLSIKLRSGEIHTMKRIGSSKSAITNILGLEVVLTLALSLVLAVVLVLLLNVFGPYLIKIFIL
ncbi:FtsX-like permease family protein [Tamlana haliotis]|uniref:FtsX-like permease family protein n=1 Tax=Pseudotamlana haliotis TaxID=2614804 RepID=A0A6N6MDL6_9FLAO|nr:ABC transporter permease [Tamlana haliotis]KAB1067793.1 FtsX-like permease family protein [Tamlana haliotis]